MKSLFDRVAEPLCYFNADGTLEYANSAGRSILGLTDTRMSPRFNELMEVGGLSFQGIMDSLGPGMSSVCITGRLKNVEAHSVSINIMPIECEDGRLSALCSIDCGHDRSCDQDMYKYIFNESPDAVFIIDLNTQTILDLNKESESLFNDEQCAMKGKKFNSLFLLEDRQRLEDMINGLTPGKTGTGTFSLEKSNGEPLQLEINARIFAFGEKQIVQIKVSDARKKEIKQRNDELSAINYIGATLNSTLDLDVMLDHTIHKVCEVTDMDIGCIFLLEDGSDMLTLYAYAGQVIPHPAGSLKVSQCIGGTAVTEKKPIAFEDFSKCPESAMSTRLFQNAASAVFVPIIFQGRALGVMDLASKKHRRFKEEDIRLFSSIANTIGAALNNANYVKYVKSQAKKFSLLFKVSSILSSTLDLKKILDCFAQNAADVSGSDTCEIFFLNENTGILQGESAYGLDENTARTDSLKPAGAIDEAITVKQARIVHDTSSDQSLPAQFVERYQIRSFLCVPLVYRDQVTGIVLLFTKGVKRMFSPQAIEVTMIMSSQAAQAIDNARLMDSMRKRNDELKRVYEIQRRVTQSIVLEETIESIVESAPFITKLPYCVIFLMNSSNERIISIKATESVATKFGKLTFNMRDLVASRIAMKERRPLFIEDAPNFKNIAKHVVKLLGIRSIIVLPLIARDRVLGIMWLYGTEEIVHFDSDDVRSAMALSDQAAIIIDNARLFKDLEDSYEKLKDLDNMKMEFFTLISHELRNPLAVIKGFAELLYDGVLGPLNEKQKERLIKIKESVDKLTDMVGKMSDISTIETRQYPVDRMPTSLNELVNGVVHSVEFISKGKNIDISVDVPMGLPLVPLDRAGIEQVLLNLINNAIKYTPSGGQIFVDAVDRDRDIMVSIKDTGISIPKKDLDKIFTGFYHAGYKLSYEYKGPGLGLAISKKIIESHGGHIWAESEEGKGSTFYFTLPKSIPEDLTTQAEAKTQIE